MPNQNRDRHRPSPRTDDDPAREWYGYEDGEPREGIGQHLERGFRMMDQDHRGHGPQGYARTDQRIHDDVCDRLTDDRHVDARQIEVKVAAGVVALAGQVPVRTMKWRAEEIAEAVTGVTEVDNQIRVRRDGAS